MKLLIVESPGKVKKIQEFLGHDFKVMASVGHVRDLPAKEMGVNAPHFKPHYVATTRGKEVLAKLSSASKNAEKVYLATDPDREGEAIAWHLADALKLANPKRVTYTEITEKAVKNALEKAGEIDMNLVYAQEGRRVLDRLVGFMVSPELSNMVGQSLSAGRVQSPALRMVVEREKAILNFKETTHYGVEIVFDEVENITSGWKAQWNTKDWLTEGSEYVLDKSLAEKISAIKAFTVVSYEESISKQAPPASFTTSTLQQASSATLKFSPKKTMEVAQKLYENGHITYMRTDSPNLSAEAITEIRSFASQNNWEVPPSPRTWKSKDGSQEAHEAIRPTEVEVEEINGTEDEKALYKLIRIRSIASQLMEAEFKVCKVVLEADFADTTDTVNIENKKVIFNANGRLLTKEGFKVLMAKDETEEENNEEPTNPIPKLSDGNLLTAVNSKLQTKKTKAPARFTEASLIKNLENQGIGRPSTYASILENIVSRDYIKIEKRKLAATDLGIQMIDILINKFEFLNFDFTKALEDSLDEIATGNNNYLEVVKKAYESLTKELSDFITANSTPCPDCGKPLRHLIRKASKDKKAYNFWSCSAYPDCKSAFQDENGVPGKKQEKKELPALSEHLCPDCQKPLRNFIKEATENEKGYNFWACSGFPNCKTSLPNENGVPGKKKEIEVSKFNCPACKKGLIRRQGTSKNNKEYDFYGCSGFPKCKKTYQTKDDGSPDF